MRGLPLDTLNELFASAPSVSLPKDRLSGGADIVELLVEGQVVKSKREAREFLQQGAILLNGTKAAADQKVHSEALLHGSVLLIRRGKKNWHVTKWK